MGLFAREKPDPFLRVIVDGLERSTPFLRPRVDRWDLTDTQLQVITIVFLPTTPFGAAFACVEDGWCVCATVDGIPSSDGFEPLHRLDENFNDLGSLSSDADYVRVGVAIQTLAIKILEGIADGDAGAPGPDRQEAANRAAKIRLQLGAGARQANATLETDGEKSPSAPPSVAEMTATTLPASSRVMTDSSELISRARATGDPSLLRLADALVALEDKADEVRAALIEDLRRHA